MTRDQLLERLRSLESEPDHVYEYGGKTRIRSEEVHETADQLLLAYINDEEITAAFLALRRWYS